MDITKLDSLSLGTAYIEERISKDEYIKELRRRKADNQTRMDYYLTNALNPLYKTDGERVWYFHGMSGRWEPSYMDPARLLEDLSEFSTPRALNNKEIGRAIVESVQSYNKGSLLEKIRGILSTR